MANENDPLKKLGASMGDDLYKAPLRALGWLGKKAATGVARGVGADSIANSLSSLGGGNEKVDNRAYGEILRLMYPAGSIFAEGHPFPATFRTSPLSTAEVREFKNACIRLKKSQLPASAADFFKRFNIDPNGIKFKAEK